MSEELNERMLGYLDTIEQTVADGACFAMDQAPAVAQEFVAYNRAESTAYVVAGAALILFACVYVRRTTRVVFNPIDWNPFHVIPPLISGITGVVLLTEGLQVIFKAWFAPRVLILEELSRLIG